VEVIKYPQTLIVQPPNSKKGNFKVRVLPLILHCILIFIMCPRNFR